MTIRVIVFLILAVSSLGACTGQPTHPWTSPPEYIQPADWDAVPDGRVRWLEAHDTNHADVYAAARERLGNHAWVALTEQEALEFWAAGKQWRPGTFDEDVREGKPYLLRGLDWHSSAWCRVWCNRRSGAVWVYHASSNGDMLQPWSLMKLDETLTVVYLDAPPTRVYVTTALMGDGIASGPPAVPGGS